jgi:hypothetical protein
MIMAGIEPSQIRDRLATSIEYVYKEKGKLKKEGLLVTQQSLSMSDGQHDITVFTDKISLQEDKSIAGYTRSNLSGYETGEYDIPPLGEEKLKLMYSAFDNNKGPIYATAELGVHPGISQREHLRFLNMKSRDPVEFQKQIVSMIIDPSAQVQSIIDKSQKQLLSNMELIELINFKIESYAQWYLKNAVNNPNYNIPFGIQRPACSVCHTPQEGVIYNVNTEKGMITRNFLDMVCKSCAIGHP